MKGTSSELYVEAVGDIIMLRIWDSETYTDVFI